VSELGDLLELLYGARGRWSSVRLTVRDWSHNERSRAAFERRIETMERRGGTSSRVSFYAPGSSDPPETSEHVTRIWIDGDRSRVESDREQGPTAVVHDGGTWWLTTPHQNLTNAGDANHHAGRGDDVEQMLDPSALSAAFELVPGAGREVAGREGIAVRAIPRDVDHHLPFFWQLLGADEIELVVDRERGVVLRTESRLAGEPYQVREIVEIAFDDEFPDELFRIELPPGESFEPAGGRRAKHLTLDQAARLASFPLFVPARPGPGWRLEHAVYLSEGALEAEIVHLNYTHETRAHQFQLAESTEAHPWLGSDELRTVERDGVVMKVLDPGEEDFPMPRHVLIEREGTHVNVMSQELPLDDLIDIAASLVRAPDSPPPPISP
jgi:hypothetical protein